MNLIPTIGIEMHCEMKSFTKVFSKSLNTYSNTLNNHVAPLDMALPGVLPVLNKECLKKAIKVALMLNCQIPETLVFDRKNYYYPDLPKGYQITQFHHPIGINGNISVPFQEKECNVFIHDVHLEEDTAQLNHLTKTSLINYNRSGVPLLELVTEPCLHSKEETMAFLEYIRKVYQYANISDADVTKGQVRCDVNVSLSETDTLGTKVEVKGVNSLANVALVIDYEIKRQTELILAGKTSEIEQSTRRWDEETLTTKRMRSKADAIDYKYFIEPNIPEIKLDKCWFEKIREEIPVLPFERLKNYRNNYNFSVKDANILLKDKNTSDFFEKCIEIDIDAKTAFNWMSGPILSFINKGISWNDFFLTPNHLKFIIDKIKDSCISSKQGKEILEKVIELKKDPQTFITNETMQISKEEDLEKIIDAIIEKNPQQLESYQNGKTNLFEFFVGQVLKETKGKANIEMTRKILTKKLVK